jgi:GDPmannose 4,6-dehydratase
MMGHTPVALVTGCSGQDGSYLCELLLEKGYVVHGLVRRSSTINTSRIDHIFDKLNLHFGDLTDGSALNRLVSEIYPDEVYNLGAQSHVRVSFDIPEYTSDVDALGTLRLLDALKSWCPYSKFYQASSSELFGNVLETPQTETTPFNPCSPYGIAKQFSFFTTKNYRNMGMFACNGILFNHESPRRGDTFVTKKIVKRAVEILRGEADTLMLGNLDAKRDWGYAKEYVEGMWLIMQQDTPDDYVLATGEMHSVREFLDVVFDYLGMDWKKYVKIDPRYYRPTEVNELLGDASKAKKVLGWEPIVKFKELAHLMVDAELVK